MNAIGVVNIPHKSLRVTCLVTKADKANLANHTAGPSIRYGTIRSKNLLLRNCFPESKYLSLLAKYIKPEAAKNHCIGTVATNQ